MLSKKRQNPKLYEKYKYMWTDYGFFLMFYLDWRIIQELFPRSFCMLLVYSQQIEN